MTRTVLGLAVIVLCSTQVIAQQATITEEDLNALDKDGDGTVSRSEYDAFSEFAFTRMDKNANGVLSTDEVDDHLIGDAFKILDDNSDGTVTADEFSSQMKEDFDSADKNSDGVLDGS